MFVFTVQDLIGLLFLALFLCLALLVWLLMLLRKVRAWVRRQWSRFTSIWSHARA
jgi:hypothetical protein